MITSRTWETVNPTSALFTELGSMVIQINTYHALVKTPHLSVYWVGHLYEATSSALLSFSCCSNHALRTASF
jgi:hypothetical protein